ncbi:hypothetical protein MRX96_053309, partial [Rhipicephalus microplus]
VICQKAGCDQAEALNFIKRWLPGSGDRCGGQGSGASEKHLLWSSPMIPTLSVQIIGCSRQLASLPSHSSQGLDSTTVTVPPNPT